MLTAAAGLLEWMNDRLAKSFQNAAASPLELPLLHRCASPDQLAALPQPMVVLASTTDLESGFARELFAHWAPHAQNLIILPDRSVPGTLAHRLAQGQIVTGETIPLRLSKRVLLQGEELASFRRAQEIERLQEQERQRLEQQQQECTSFKDLFF